MPSPVLTTAPPDAIIVTGWVQPHGAEQTRGADSYSAHVLEHIEFGPKVRGREKWCKKWQPSKAHPEQTIPKNEKSTHSIALWPTRQ